MNQMGKMVLMSSAWKAYVDFRHIELEFGCNEEINPEIHPELGYPDSRGPRPRPWMNVHSCGRDVAPHGR
jgi:hypothetical protein